MDKTEFLSDTRRVISLGKTNGLAVRIKTDIVKILEIKQGSMVEIRIRNTGTVLPKMNRGQNAKETSQEQ